MKTIKLPPKSPNLNAYAERFARSIREECLSRMVPLGERHLRKLIREYVIHYHEERNHQGLDNRLIKSSSTRVILMNKPVKRQQRLGGMLNYYYREAA